jgi:hypothetical protein
MAARIKAVFGSSEAASDVYMSTSLGLSVKSCFSESTSPELAAAPIAFDLALLSEDPSMEKRGMDERRGIFRLLGGPPFAVVEGESER